jgi:Kdo2-lipid IVA lauroyltransferase/acyltransferase
VRRNVCLDYLVYLLVRVAVSVVQALTLESCARKAKTLAWLCSDVLGIRAAVVTDNLLHAYPELTPDERQQLARGMWEHLFLLAVEMAQAPRKIHLTNWRDYIDLVRREMLVEVLFDDRPVVLVSAHYGNFELSGYVLGILGFSSFTIARPLDNPFLNRFVNEFRGAQGQYIFPKSGSAQQIDSLLARGGTLTLLADQHAGDKGCWVDFFSRPASTHKAIALFALVNDAPLVLCYSQRVGKPLRHLLGAEEMVDPRKLAPELRSVPALTQWYTDHLEAIIRRAPEQYWWVHRRWKGEPPRKARRRAA